MFDAVCSPSNLKVEMMVPFRLPCTWIFTEPSLTSTRRSVRNASRGDTDGQKVWPKYERGQKYDRVRVIRGHRTVELKHTQQPRQESRNMVAENDDHHCHFVRPGMPRHVENERRIAHTRSSTGANGE